jgi:hypothetical protein
VYSAAFLTLAAVATIGLLVFFFAMPETGKGKSSVEPDTGLRNKSGATRAGASLPSAAQ